MVIVEFEITKPSNVDKQISTIVYIVIYNLLLFLIIEYLLFNFDLKKFAFIIKRFENASTLEAKSTFVFLPTYMQKW